MRPALTGFLLVLLLIAGCGGGDGGGIAAASCIGFTGAQAPAAGRVAARQASGGSCSAIFVELVVTDVADVFSGSFTLEYDPASVALGGASATGSFLASGGARVDVVQSAPQSGSATIGVTRVQTTAGVDVSGSQVLVRVSFAPVAAGTSQLSVTGAQLFGSETPPQAKANLTWTGGTFNVQ
jgi:hypothetical protein